MAPSLWAQPQQATSPVDPAMLQPVNMPDAAPSTSAFASPQPNVQRAPSPMEQQISNDQQRLEKVRWEQQNPWGTEDNHPGKMGKIAHAFSTLGNIAGDIFAPTVMANIPGTQMNRQMQEGGLTHRLNEEIGQESQDQARDAGTAKTTAETSQIAPDAESKRGLEGAEADKARDEIANPSLAAGYAHAVSQAIKEGRDPAQDPIVQHLSDAITSIQRKPVDKSGEAPKTIQIEQGGKPHQMAWDAKTGKYDVDQGESGEKPALIRVETAGEKRGAKNDLLKAYQPTLDSAERMNVMTDAYEKGVKNHDQQAMLNLLANHLGMTMGLQKGARITKDIIQEAQHSQPWLQGIEAKFGPDGYATGVNLAPQQMRQMVNLGQERYAEDAKKSRSTAQYLGSKDDGPDRVPGKSTINYYLGLSNGDPNKAKQLATQDGWTVR